MAGTLPSLQVAVADHSAIVKVNGRANFTTSVGFKHLVSELRQRGFRKFALDLTQCVTMDSTFLGVLAGTAVKLSGTQEPPHPKQDRDHAATAQLRLLNPNQRVIDLLDNLGISELFSPVYCQVPGAAPEKLTAAEDVHPSQEELSQTCLEAHRILMDLNPENVPKFKDVAEFLAQDLKKIQGDHGEAAPEQKER
jgi:anti-anti-sigma regulatory factor